MTAIIFMRGHHQESQEALCRLYAAEKGYEVLYTTTEIEAVKDCDVMVIADYTRISRKQIEFYKIINRMKEMGVKIESAMHGLK